MWAGLLIGIGLIVIIHKMSIHWKLRMTTYEVTTDIAVFVLVNMVHGAHGGTHGVLHAAVAAVVVSLYISWLKKRIGYWHKDKAGDKQLVRGSHPVNLD